VVDGRHPWSDARKKGAEITGSAAFWKIIEPLRIIKLEFSFVKVEA